MPISEDSVREALKQVIDPELFVNIIDLGLVYTVVVEPAGEKENIKIEMTMTSPACPAGPQLIGQSKQVLAAIAGSRRSGSEAGYDPAVDARPHDRRCPRSIGDFLNRGRFLYAARSAV